jgi:Beta-L-arabinofuranosidase, GH127
VIVVAGFFDKGAKMHRRDFLINSFLASGRLALPRGAKYFSFFGKGGSSNYGITSSHIGYIRESIPHFEIPRYTGETYSDRVPDTFDIAERCKLGIHALTAIADPRADYEIYGAADFFRNPAAMVHDFNDWTQNQEGFMEALPLLRLASGDSQNSEVDPIWMRSTLHSIGPDGLLYVPLNGRPWGRLGSDGVNPVWRKDGSQTKFQDPSVTQFANVSTCQRMIGTMTVYYLRDKNPMWIEVIQAMVRRLNDLAIHRKDYCYFAAGSFEPDAKVDPNAAMPTGSLWGVSWNTRLIQGLAQYYRVTHDKPAAALGQELTNYALYHSDVFDSDGRWLLDPEFRGAQGFPDFAVPDYVKKQFGREGMRIGGHSHGHMIALLALVDFADAIQHRELWEFCKKIFDWSRQPGEEYGVSLRVGWFPEFYVPGYPSADADPQADMIGVGLKLSDAGLGDYWDEVDRWVRNQFAEQQLTDVTDLKALSARSPSKPLAWNESADDVADKSLGAYGSSVSGNDWALGLASTGIAQCCTGSATRTLYYIWNRMLSYQDGELRVNLLMNRASPWADIYSYIPYEGRVDLKVKKQCQNVKLRAPEWITTSNPALSCTINGHVRTVRWQGRYIDLGTVNPGDKVTVEFPISEQTIRERIGPVTYTLVLRGNTVVSIDPKGKNVPLYQGRERYRSNATPWREVTRFVSTETIEW